MLTPITRRGVLAAFAGVPAASAAGTAPFDFPEQPTILVAGPAGGRLDHWADVIAEPLGRALQQGSALVRQNAGGPDGVTGANQFQARAAPDGGTALLVPGTAALSWLTGDTRVRFEAGRWIPLWGGNTSAALAGRVRLTTGRPLRMPVHSIVGPELTALLALDLTGCQVTPVGVDQPDANLLGRSDLDIMFLRGAALQDEARLLAARGWSLVLSFGTIGPNGEVARDPSYSNLPIPQELIAGSRGVVKTELALALRAVTAAMKLDLALVLPELSPAAVVAWWRRGCGALAAAAEVQTEALRTQVRPIGSGAAAATVSSITVDAPVLLALRRWLAERHQWRPT